MAKQIIVLDTLGNDGGTLAVTAVFWFPVTSGQESPKPTLTASAWTGASAPEITALQLGTVIEEVQQYRFPNSYTLNQIKTELVSLYAARKVYLDALPFKGQYYGRSYDGTSWT
jgi:hypothetical protein